ncbi:MAG: GNAT family N-acetyltransferase [Ferrimicrobium acidiphilum]
MPSDVDNSAASFQFVPPRSLHAGWLTCRLIEDGDADYLYEAVLASMDHLRPWMPWVTGYNRQMADEYVSQALRVASGQPAHEAIYVPTDSENSFLGVFGLHARLGPGALEIGYWVDVRHTCRGVGTLSATLLTEAAFSITDVERVEIHHDEANRASGAIPERLGYERLASHRREPEAPAEVGVEVPWRMLRSSWPSSKAAKLLAALRQE